MDVGGEFQRSSRKRRPERRYNVDAPTDRANTSHPPERRRHEITGRGDRLARLDLRHRHVVDGVGRPRSCRVVAALLAGAAGPRASLPIPARWLRKRRRASRAIRRRLRRHWARSCFSDRPRLWSMSRPRCPTASCAAIESAESGTRPGRPAASTNCFTCPRGSARRAWCRGPGPSAPRADRRSRRAGRRSPGGRSRRECRSSRTHARRR
jgi:hypothetical protein